MSSIHDRAIALIELSGIDNLIRQSEIGMSRWQTVKYRKARIAGDEIEVLCKVFPQYAYWLSTGMILPESGQISPDHEDLKGNVGVQN